MPSTGTLINPDVTNAVLPPSPIVRFLKSVAAVAISTVPLDVFGPTMLPTALQAATSAGLRVTCTLSEPGAGVTVRQLLSSSVERIRKQICGCWLVRPIAVASLHVTSLTVKLGAAQKRLKSVAGANCLAAPAAHNHSRLTARSNDC